MSSQLVEAKTRLKRLISDDRSLKRFDEYSNIRKIDAIMKAQIAIIIELQKIKSKIG